MTLAEAPERARLPMPPFLRRRGFLAPEERRALLAWSYANEARFEPAQLRGMAVDPSVRRSLLLRDLGPLRQVFEARLAALLPTLIEALGLPAFAPSGIELELAAHNDGAHFALHTDTYTQPRSSARSHRVVSSVYYFHDEPRGFSGGQLRLHRFGATAASASDSDGALEDIEPEQNCLVAFPSWAPHEVRPVACPTRAFGGSRFAVNAWIHRASGEP
jgi:Rps23 Pro-64 3,4-dihydroxylase Tpa1-like proline 4-hydroxylase